MRIQKKPKKQNKAEQPKVNGYLRISSTYVSIVFLASVLISIFAFGVLYMTALHPTVMALWYKRKSMPEFSIQSPYLAEYIGKARLLLPDGSLLYEGDVGGAVIGGNGRLYQNGRLLYDGGFAENLYNGRGTLYSDDGSVVYTGDFTENLFHGDGTQYFTRGRKSCVYSGAFDTGVKSGEGTLIIDDVLVYEGGFKDNMRDGSGREYENDKLRYEGMFLRDVYDGEGKLFDGDGQLIYEGSFKENVRDGFGREYENEKLRYEGVFLRDAYDGEGKLFDDGGRLIYEGGFSSGRYSGDGTEYDPDTGFPVFQGKHLDGGRMEAGTEFDAGGTPIANSPSNPDPMDLLDSTYTDALTALSKNSAVVREQTIDGRSLLIDEAGGVIYAFLLNEAGEPEALSEMYLFGLGSAGGLIVGSEMGDTPESPATKPEIGEGEIFALSLSNAFWGKETREDELNCVALEKDGLGITAFCEATEKPNTISDSLAEDLPNNGLEDSYAKVLPGDPPKYPTGKVLPGDPSPMKAGRIVFLKVIQSSPDEKTLPLKE